MKHPSDSPRSTPRIAPAALVPGDADPVRLTDGLPERTVDCSDIATARWSAVTPVFEHPEVNRTN